MPQQHKHIYIGLGTMVLLLGSALLLRKTLFRINKKEKLIKKIDFKVFDSPDQVGSGKCIDPELVQKLRLIESVTGYPIFQWINSGVRTPNWNGKVGGVANSSHKIPNCKAVDIKASSLSVRNQLVLAAKKVGFKRIGVGKTFVHLDVDSTKSQYVAWGYPSGTRPEINPFV